MIPENAPKLEIDFTDEKLSGRAGLAFIAQQAKRLNLPRLIKQSIHLKQRNRGCGDDQMLLSLIYSFCCGNGSLSDVDALKADTTTMTVLGLRQVPDSRRLGEYLSRFTPQALSQLLSLVRTLSQAIAPAIIEHHREQDEYIPVFMDGSGIEVSGKLFEGAGKGYNGEDQYWLHGVFVGGGWVSGRLHPGGVDVAKDWREQLDTDVAPLFTPDDSVWLRLDNAYYRGALVSYCQDHGWDYSISLTDDRKRRPVLDQLEGLGDGAWTDIGLGESAIFAYHQPAKWATEQSYVVIRRLYEDKQKLIRPAYTVILVSRDDLPLSELVKRHRGKQGQENAFKGPLIDLDLHHPPCRQFMANQAFYLCGQIAQLLLRAVQYQLLPKAARKHGIRPIIRYLIRSCARLVHSGRQLKLVFAKTAFRLDWIYYAACQIE